MEGDIDEVGVLRWMARFAELGVDGFTLCDTTGMAYPSQVGQMSRHARIQFPTAELTLHFHNTWNGIGQCTGGHRGRYRPLTPPWAGWADALTLLVPVATCVPRTWYMLQLMGYDTGVDLSALLQASGRLQAWSVTTSQVRY
jgi:hydroxymethylglutaryl-CoA lyase